MKSKSNVVALKPKPRPALELSELRLIDDTCDVKMTLRDDAGNFVSKLSYKLVDCEPDDFDLDLLRAAWDRRR